MSTGNKSTFRTHPSLLSLRIALIAAESGSPSRPPRTDANEQLAMQLIEKIKAGYQEPLPLLDWTDIPSQYGFHKVQEMAGTHAQ